MINEIENANNDQQFFEIKLTPVELKGLGKLLPKGYSLEIPKKVTTPHSSKKHSISELSHVNRILDLGTPENPELYSSTNKRALRDHSKQKITEHLERKYSDFEAAPTTSSKVAKPASEGLRKCYNLLQKLKRHHSSTPFLEPVDVEGLGLTDYYEVVSEPMDLSTIENKMKSEEYTSTNQFAADVRKIWSNAFKYNPKGTDVYQLTVDMSTYFEKLFKEIEGAYTSDSVKDLEKKVEKLSKQIIELGKGSKPGQSGSKPPTKPPIANEKPLSVQEKKVLCGQIKSLSPEHLKGVWEIVSEGISYKGFNREVLEFDIDTLPPKVARDLERFVKFRISQQVHTKPKPQPKPKEAPVSKAPKAQPRRHAAVSTAVSRPEIRYSHSPYQEMQVEPEMVVQSNLAEQYDSYKQAASQSINRKDSSSDSSESSFITDSDSDSDIGDTKRKLIH